MTKHSAIVQRRYIGVDVIAHEGKQLTLPLGTRRCHACTWTVNTALHILLPQLTVEVHGWVLDVVHWDRHPHTGLHGVKSALVLGLSLSFIKRNPTERDYWVSSHYFFP